MVAICSMVRKPFNFETWIDYHISLGIDYIFLRVEDTPELAETIKSYPNIIAEFTDQHNKKNNYLRQMDRQVDFIISIKDKLIELDIKWIIHIDSDELFCSNNLNFIKNVKNDINVLHFINYEAVYTNDNLENPFLQTNLFRDNKNTLAYCNGKSAARVTKNMTPVLSHTFKGKMIRIPPSVAVILHYESPTFEKWYEKFKVASNIDIEIKDKIPFEFYKKSLELVELNNLDEARDYYNKMKVNVNDDLLKLYWTPLLREKNINWS